MSIEMAAKSSFRFGLSLISLCMLCAVLTGCDRRDDRGIILDEVRGKEISLPEDEYGTLTALPSEGIPETGSLTGVPGDQTTYDSGEQCPDVSDDIYVHVCGAVSKEGVYSLTAGARVVEAVEAAGGFTDDADRSYVNLAGLLQDGMKIRIPTIEESSQASAETGGMAVTEAYGIEQASQDKGESAASGKININTASEEQLCSLPGVGTARAKSIIEYRETHGGFSCIEDIMKVSGIKERSFARIRELIDI